MGSMLGTSSLQKDRCTERNIICLYRIPGKLRPAHPRHRPGLAAGRGQRPRAIPPRAISFALRHLQCCGAANASRLLAAIPAAGTRRQIALACAEIGVREYDQLNSNSFLLFNFLLTTFPKELLAANLIHYFPCSDQLVHCLRYHSELNRFYCARARPASSPGSSTSDNSARSLKHLRPRSRAPGRRHRTRLGTPHAFLLDRIIGFTNARGVDHRDRLAVEIELHFDDVARGAGIWRDDRDLAPRQMIDQCRFADVRRACDRDHQSVAQPFALALAASTSSISPRACDLCSAGAINSAAHRLRRKNRCRPRSAPTPR